MADACRYYHLRVKEKLLKLGASVSCTDPRIFYWKENKELVGILMCHADGGTTKSEASVKKKLKQIFKFGNEDSEAFTCIGRKKIIA